jgi:uncharacterized repeat protein (TIGR03803 family)
MSILLQLCVAANICSRNRYGTTVNGGAYGKGTVFKISAKGLTLRGAPLRGRTLCRFPSDEGEALEVGSPPRLALVC